MTDLGIIDITSPMSVPPPSPFSANNPKFQTAWDSTSLGWLKECPTQYKYQMINGWSSKSKGIHLMFGGLYAAGMERFAHARASGQSHHEATLTMVRWALSASGERDPETGEWTPWSPGDHADANIKNRYTLLRSLVWNVEDRNGSPFSTVILANGKPAVELSFHFNAFEIGGETIQLSGHLDQLVKDPNGAYWVLDDKTTKSALNASYFQSYSPHNQMSLYSIAGKVILNEPVRGVLVRAAQIGVSFTRFATAQVPRPASVLTEWLSDTQIWIAQAKAYADADYWPRNDKSCFWCVFKKVCSVSPSHRQAWLEDDFEHRVWNPLAARGDI